MIDEGWYYGHGSDAEVFHGPYATRVEAIDEALSECEPIDDREDDHAVVIAFGGRTELDNDIFDVDWVLERFANCNEEHADEDGELLDMTTSTEQDTDLRDTLKTAFAAWRERHRIGRAWTLDFTNREVLTVAEMKAVFDSEGTEK